jgi:hypothetical protein
MIRSFFEEMGNLGFISYNCSNFSIAYSKEIKLLRSNWSKIYRIPFTKIPLADACFLNLPSPESKIPSSL